MIATGWREPYRRWSIAAILTAYSIYGLKLTSSDDAGVVKSRVCTFIRSNYKAEGCLSMWLRFALDALLSERRLEYGINEMHD